MIQRDDDGLDVVGGHEHGESRQVWDTSEDVPSGFVDGLDVKHKRVIGDSKIFGQGNRVNGGAVLKWKMLRQGQVWSKFNILYVQNLRCFPHMQSEILVT